MLKEARAELKAATNTEGGMINGDALALARGAEALHREGLTLLGCILEIGKSAPSCLSAWIGKGKDEAFFDLECY